MTSPSVIDTNVLKYFFDEMLSDKEDKFSIAVRAVMSKGAVAIDDEGQARQEYLDCCKPSSVGLSLDDWVVLQLNNGAFRVFQMDKSARNELRKLGLPNKDHKWVFIAKGSSADLIVSEDIDLFDPKSKKSTEKVKAKIKRNSSGPVAKYLKKKHGITVCCCDGALCFVSSE
ncbi:hypothetical protein [Paralimibaculum aggregatum]|uniref:hypothetical protein n=1 Tax=Paralimibaculum aggregatum TaxID=3036245 RepID=UPI002555D998|nr:hypothetical protein [Limibaculum sp. NKW23]